MSVMHPARWKTVLAFGIIYVVWGSTFLAIRIGVEQVPPLLLAGLRFFIAGVAMYVWFAARATPAPKRREWLSAILLAFLIFVVDYGCLFWAERRVPSGLAAVVLGTIPLFTALAEIVLLRTQRLTVRLSAALFTGLVGVAVLVSRTLHLGGEPIDQMGAVALVVGSLSWSIASALTKKLPLPAAKTMNSAAQMLAGGILLFVSSAVAGEFQRFHAAQIDWKGWAALGYLVVFGSIIGFTVYLWLLDHHSPTVVSTYAYVNPVVAVVLGYFAAGEPMGLRTVLGTLLVLTSVAIITIAPARYNRSHAHSSRV